MTMIELAEYENDLEETYTLEKNYALLLFPFALCRACAG